MKCDKYIGMDVHQATTVVVVLDGEGKLVFDTIVATEAATIIRLLQNLSGSGFATPRMISNRPETSHGCDSYIVLMRPNADRFRFVCIDRMQRRLAIPRLPFPDNGQPCATNRDRAVPAQPLR